MKIDDYYVMKFSSLPLQFMAMYMFFNKSATQHFSARNFMYAYSLLYIVKRD